MTKITELVKKSSKWFLYLFALVTSVFSVTYLQEKNLAYTLVFIFISLSSYAFLIIKDFKFLSGLSYVSLILFFLCTMGNFGESTGNGEFINAESEKIFYLMFGFSALWVVTLCMYLITTQGWRKKLSSIFLVLVALLLLILGTAAPNFYDSFIYTRVLVSIVFLLSILLIFKKKKLLRLGGLIGIGACLVSFLTGALLFSAQIYEIEKVEKEKVLNLVNPKVQEMFQYYNQRDFENFCVYCSEDLKFKFVEGLQNFTSSRDSNGRHVSHKEPNVTRSKGFYYVEYPVKFENIADPLYFTIMLSDIGPEDTIYGFNISPNRGE